jgi:hypothetical protein
MSLEKTSKPKIKRKWERESPCLNPLLGEKKPNGLSFKRMEKEEEVMQILIQLIQIGLNPSFSIIERRNPHSILSTTSGSLILLIHFISPLKGISLLPMS